MTALSLLAALVTLAVVKRPRTVPLSQCSELYQRYHKVKGIEASYIQDFALNDSTTVNVTVLKATDSAMFVYLLTSLGKSEDYVRYLNQNHPAGTRFVGIREKDRSMQAMDDGSQPDKDIVAYSPIKKTVVVFHVETQELFDIILLGNLRKNIDI